MTDHPARVAYAVPLLNEAAYVREAVQSLVSQTYPSLEIHVIDAGSTDGTIEILSELGVPVEVVQKLGQMATINRVWRATTAKYVGWWAGDDVMYPGAVGRLAEALEGAPDAVVAHGDADLIDASGRRLARHVAGQIQLRELVSAFRLVPQSSLIRRDALAQSGMMNESLRLAADWDLFLRLAQYGRLEYVPSVLSARRIHAGSEDAQDLASGARACIEVVSSFFERPDLTAAQRRLRARGFAATTLLAGWAAAMGGDRAGAIRALRDAFGADPKAIWDTPQGRRLMLRLAFGGAVDRFSLTARAAKAGKV